MSLFPIRLRELRKDNKLKQKDMAELLNISRNTFSNYETGNREPCIEKIIKIALIFDCTTDYLIGVDEYFKKNVS
jgi:transcriptional regulator with XRE-family HTH domain